MLHSVADLSINGTIALCDYFGGAVWTAVTQHVCDSRDITSSGIDDDTTACDSVSVAIGFDGVAAQIASKPSAFPVTATPCADAGLCN